MTYPPLYWWPESVRGWLHEDEGAALNWHARSKRVLEVGTFCGLSAIIQARGAEHVHCVDPLRCVESIGDSTGENVYEECQANLERHHVRDKVTLHVGTSPEELLQLAAEGRRFTFGFHDGAHDAKSVARDIPLMVSLLEPGSWLAFHDYGSDQYPAVAEVVDRWRGDRPFELVRTLALVRV